MQTASETSRALASGAAQPADEHQSVTLVGPSSPRWGDDEAWADEEDAQWFGSDALPDEDQSDVISNADSLVIPTAHTPLYNHFLMNLSDMDMPDLWITLKKELLNDKVKTIPRQDAEQGTCYSLAARVEHMLQLAMRQRQRVDNSNTGVLSERQYQRVINDWTADFRSWMNFSKQAEYDRAISNSKRQSIVHSAFSTMLFQNFGNHRLAKVLIQYPMTTFSQANALNEFARTWREYVASDAYRKAKEKSHQAADPGHVRRSSRIWRANQAIKNAQHLDNELQRDWNIWWSFSDGQKILLKQYRDGGLQEALVQAKRNDSSR